MRGGAETQLNNAPPAQPGAPAQAGQASSQRQKAHGSHLGFNPCSATHCVGSIRPVTYLCVPGPWVSEINYNMM